MADQHGGQPQPTTRGAAADEAAHMLDPIARRWVGMSWRDFLRDFGFPLFMLVLVVVLSILTVVGVLPLAR